MIFTNNFYSLLINAFSRNINQARHISKDYNGNTNVEVPNDRATAMARTMFNTGNGTDSMPIPSGVGNNLVTESDLTSTNVFKDDAGYPAGEISRNVTSNTSHDIGMLILGSGTTAPTKDDYKLESFIGEISSFKGLKVRGLMSVPPICDSKQEIFKFFDKMYKLFIDISSKKIDNISMDYLSMGMSDDYNEAILSGANMIRVGSGLFGARIYR